MAVKVLVVVAAMLCCAHAIGTQTKYGYAIVGPYGASQVESSADDHAYGYQVNNKHKTGVSYIKQSGPNHHGYGYGGYGLGLYGGGAGYGLGGYGGGAGYGLGGYGGYGLDGYGGYGLGYGGLGLGGLAGGYGLGYGGLY